MAFKNYLANNTYSTINNLFYEKLQKRCVATLDIWSDDSKKTMLASKQITVEGQHKCLSLYSLKEKIKNEPSSLNSEIGYIIADDAEGVFAGYEGQLTKYNSVTKNWDKWVLWQHLLVFVEDEQKYYLYTDGKWAELPDMTMDVRIWDKWLAPEVSLIEGTNPVSQMYKLMKTLPQFKDCKDV
jgi:hypothetical protein